jgi:hypothetical protein
VSSPSFVLVFQASALAMQIFVKVPSGKTVTPRRPSDAIENVSRRSRTEEGIPPVEPLAPAPRRLCGRRAP